MTGGNFATLNPLDFGGTTLKEGNLETSSSANGDVFSSQQVPNTGKWYFEFRTSDVGSGYVGVREDSYKKTNYSWGTANVRGKTLATTTHYPSTTDGSRTGIAMVDGDIGMCAIDMDNGKIWWGVNGTWASSGDPVAGTNQIYSDLLTYGQLPLRVHYGHSSTTASLNFNFGQDSSFAGNETPQGNTDDNGVGDFYYAPPSGSLALNTGNLPTPTITAPDDYFNTVLYTGNGTFQSITGVGHQPDWTWIKLRNGASGHRIVDSVRGVTKYLDTASAATETTNGDRVTSFDNDGFTLGNSATVNGSFNYVAWNWKAGGTAVSNTSGSISSTVSANTDSGFSIVTYTGTGTAGTIGHGLLSAPEMVMVKSRTLATSWPIYHAGLISANYRVFLDYNNAQGSSLEWNSTAPTSSVFSVGPTGYSVNNSSQDYVAYCFHSVEGYSKIGTYESNNSTNGPYVHLGFKPAWILMKDADRSAMSWVMFDNKRGPVNPNDESLNPSTTAAEPYDSNSDIDFLSNGFKLRGGSSSWNNYLTETYIYIAFAEAPFKSANAR